MKRYLIAERYAEGLAKAIEDTGRKQAALEALQAIAAAYTEVHDFRSALSNPAIAYEQRAKVLESSLAAMQIDVPEVTQLTELLLRRARISLLPEVVRIFSGIVDEATGFAGAQVRSAAPLTDIQQERVSDALERFTGAKIRMECDVDASLLGGVVARVGSKVIDGSVRSRLNRLRASILAEEG